jgi:hypothetical protein
MARKKSDEQSSRKPARTRGFVPIDYEEFLGKLKQRIRTAQLGAAVAVNRELALLFWGIGQNNLERQEKPVGKPKSSTGCLLTFSEPSPGWRHSAREISFGTRRGGCAKPAVAPTYHRLSSTPSVPTDLSPAPSSVARRAAAGLDRLSLRTPLQHSDRIGL